MRESQFLASNSKMRYLIQEKVLENFCEAFGCFVALKSIDFEGDL